MECGDVTISTILWYDSIVLTCVGTENIVVTWVFIQLVNRLRMFLGYCYCYCMGPYFGEIVIISVVN